MKFSLEKKLYLGFGLALLILIVIVVTLLQQRIVAQETSIYQTILIVSLGSFLTIMAVVIATVVINFDLTKRRYFEEALQEGEARFQTTFEEAPIGIGLTNMQGEIIASNLAFQNMFGYNAEELQQMTIAQLTYADNVPETMGLFQELVNGERQAYQIEKRYLRKDNQIIWGRITASLVCDSQGQPLFVMGMIEDITEHKKAEEALRQSEAKYRLVVDNVKEVIFQVDPVGSLTFLNSAWTEITGFSVEECLGTSFLDYLYPDEHQSNADLFLALLEQELEYCRQAFRFVAKDGHLCWLEVYAQLTRATDGTILGISGTLNDISDRKRAEQALRASETRYRTLTTHAPVGIFEINAQGDCIFVNQRWCELTGITFAEAMGQGWTKALHPDDRERVLAEMRSTHESGEELALEHRYQTPAGIVSWVFVNAVTMRNETGDHLGVIGTVTDITAGKEVEEILAQRAAQLMLINDISSKVAAVLDLDSVLDRAANLVQNTFGYHHVALFLLDNDVARLKAIAGSYTGYFPSDHSQALDQGIIGWVATHGVKVVAGDVSQDPHYISKIADETVTQAELCLPIKVAGQVVGVLDIQSPHLDAFGESDILLMETLVAQIAVAIENARLYRAIQQELTERIQTQEALAKERNLLRTLIDNLPDLVFVKDTESRLVLVNQASLERGQRTVDELIGKTDFDLHPPELAAQYYADDQVVVQSGQPLIDHEEPNIDAAGRLRWFSTTKVPLRDSQGQVIGLVGMSRNITERKQAEEALRESEIRYRSLFENMLEGYAHCKMLFEHDKPQDFIYLDINGAFEELTGLKHVVGKKVSEVIPGIQESNPELFEIYGRVALTGQPERFETYVASLGIWFSIAVYSPRKEYFVAIFDNITARKQTEEALAKERNLLRAFVDHIPDPMYVKDKESRFIMANQAVANVMGVSTPAEVIGKTDLDFHPEALAIQNYNDEQAIIQSDCPRINGEERVLDRSLNEERWFLATKIPFKDRDGNIVGLVGLGRDITKHKQMTEKLRESEERFRQLAENINEVFLLTVPGHEEMIYLSPAYERVWGRTRQSRYEKAHTLLDTIHPEDREKVKTALEKDAQGEQEKEYRIVRPDGVIRWIRSRTFPVRNEAGKVYRIAGLAEDITERKQMEQALLEAKEAAEAATRAKSAFLANMSHEIRTPLNAIIGMTSLLLDTPLAPDQQEFAETVRISGDTLLTIINDILDFSKIEAGKLELDEQSFDLRQSIEQALDLVAVKAAEKKLELAYLVDDKTPGAIVGDVVRLRQILVNLLSNAVKFTDAGEVIVTVTSRLVDDEQWVASDETSFLSPVTRPLSPVYELHFAVRDTGLGIPQERMDRLFKAFSQGDASMTRKYGGTGLGLAISHRLCQLMEGKMWVESTGVPGEGSIFHFTIRTTAAPSQPRIYLRGLHSELVGKQMLVIDDNATNRLILKRQAQAWGMFSTAVATGAEALELLRLGHTFDLAILDMQMPEMDGLSLATEIRRLEETMRREAMTRTSVDLASPPHPLAPSPLPLVMLTSLGPREVGYSTNGVEFAAILNKPIKSSQLYDVLIGVFNKQPIKVKPDLTGSSPFDAQLGQRHPLRILLAEDNVVNQKVAIRFLGKLGYQADVATNGLEVIDALNRRPYDVILMDVHMPEMDGLETTRFIRQQGPPTQQPWIIAMTANVLQGDRELCLEAGMDDYVSKPVRIEELSRALSESQPCIEQAAEETYAQPNGTEHLVALPFELEAELGRAEIEAILPVEDLVTPTLDPRALAKLREILGEQAAPAITELINLFIENGETVLEKMRMAIQTGNAQEVFRTAHTLKPGAAHLGVMRLAALCTELEEFGRAGQLKEAEEKFVALEAEFRRVEAALEAEREKDRITA
jgi:PAS domain S-box-containing protein